MSKKYSTSNYLVIVESPAKCNKIEKILGPGYKVIASYGHLRELTSIQNINIDNNFSPTYTIINNTLKKKQIEKIKSEISRCDEVILASDDDREGEAIAWHICQLFNLNITKTKRIIFNEITESAIKNAIKNPTIINMDVVYAQQARQILDLLVGFRVSPVLWNYFVKKSKNALSAGRCQTPALRLIYDNQKEIDDSEQKKVFNTCGYFMSENIAFDLNKQFETDDEMIEFLDGMADFNHFLKVSTPSKSIKKPPEPLTTSKIQQKASNELHISPKETMKLCQELYEGGHITYMRTDSQTYSKDFLSEAEKYIQKEYGEKYVNPDIEKLSESPKKKGKGKKKEADKNVQEAHEAIRPTNIFKRKIDDLSPKQEKMYKLIWENTTESCMSNAEYNSISSVINTFDGLKFTNQNELVCFPGWQEVAKKYKTENKEFQFLLHFNCKQKINYNKVYCKVSIKNQKMHFTEARLVQLLEEKGIGRPSTFSMLVDKIQERGYVKKENVTGKEINCTEYEMEKDEIFSIEKKKEIGNEKNKLIIQPLGKLVSEFLNDKFIDIFNYEFTSQMEKELDLVSKGDMKHTQICSNCNNILNNLIGEIKVDKKLEYKIDSKYTYIVGKYGPVLKYTEIIKGKEKTCFKPVKENLDFEKMKNNEYSIDEIIKVESTSVLGEYKGKDILLKNGKYGMFASFDGKSYSLKDLSYEDIKEINVENSGNSNIIRKLNDDLSIRKGPKGEYIFYKTIKMKKPQFFDLKKYSGDYNNDIEEEIVNWITRTYLTK
jgi:DNA topoisomerase-1